jgi:enhancing lycopene biosynthesis protein 2
VLLAGSGVYDGTECTEAVSLLVALGKHKASVQCFAPNTEQHHVVNHLTGEEMEERRNVMVESARLARGEVMAIE